MIVPNPDLVFQSKAEMETLLNGVDYVVLMEDGQKGYGMVGGLTFLYYLHS